MSLFTANIDLYSRQDGSQSSELDAVIGREREYEELCNVLSTTIDGADTVGVIVGPRGSGKTTLLRQGLDEFRSDSEFATAIVDCEAAGTVYRTLIRAVNEIRAASETLAETGHSFTAVEDALWRELNTSAGTQVLVFDRFDVLEQWDSFGSLARHPDTGVICIADQPEISSVPNTWPARSEVRFSAYTAADLRTLLEKWAHSKMSDKPLSDEVIPLCAAYGAEAGGDAHVALQILRDAGRISQEERTDQILGRQVQRAKETAEQERLAERIDRLDEHGQVLLYSTLSLAETDELPARTEALYDEYLAAATDASFDPVSRRRIQDRIHTVAQAGLLDYTEHNDGRAGGVYRIYRLACETEQLQLLVENNREYTESTVSGLFN